MIFQDPLSSLHPYYTVGNQIIEAYRVHHPEVTKQQARQRAIDMLERVGIPQPSARVDDYPHQFSGGMRQRVMIAMALCNDPGLLIADEPTTALDVTVQAQILDLIHDLQSEFGSAVIMITHDLGVVAELSDDILVMYAGRVAEYGSAADIFGQPGHPYTWGLLASMPRMDRERLTRLVPIPGTPPSLIRVPSGCPFHPRCRYGHLNGGRSETEVPELRATEDTGHLVACHLTAAERTKQWGLLSAGQVPERRQGTGAARRGGSVSEQVEHRPGRERRRDRTATCCSGLPAWSGTFRSPGAWWSGARSGRSRPWTGSTCRWPGARPSAWSASRGAGRPPPAAC